MLEGLGLLSFDVGFAMVSDGSLATHRFRSRWVAGTIQVRVIAKDLGIGAVLPDSPAIAISRL